MCWRGRETFKRSVHTRLSKQYNYENYDVIGCMQTPLKFFHIVYISNKRLLLSLTYGAFLKCIYESMIVEVFASASFA